MYGKYIIISAKGSLKESRLTMCTVPEAPDSAGRSQEHLPCVHGTDQSFTASARWPAARTRVRQNAAESFTEKGILRQKNVIKQTNEDGVGKERNAENCKENFAWERSLGTKTKGTTFGPLEVYTCDTKYCCPASSSCDPRFHTAVRTSPVRI